MRMLIRVNIGVRTRLCFWMDSNIKRRDVYFFSTCFCFFVSLLLSTATISKEHLKVKLYKKMFLNKSS